VVVLGKTGRNFAAGMSGGVAYVFDDDGLFTSRCNTGMVEIEELDDEDVRVVRDLVGEHVLRTSSARGEELLASWDAVITRVKKIIPTEYKRILAAERERESAPGARHLRLVKG
jgi:glutamate synthase domain-containing protein 3